MPIFEITRQINTDDTEATLSVFKTCIERQDLSIKDYKLLDIRTAAIVAKHRRYGHVAIKIQLEKVRNDCFSVSVSVETARVRTWLYWTIIIILSMLTFGVALGFVLGDMLVRPSETATKEAVQSMVTAAVESMVAKRGSLAA